DETPLLHVGGTHERIPQADGGVSVGIIRPENGQTLIDRCADGGLPLEDGFILRVEGRIEGQPEIGPGAFHERRNRVSAPEHSIAPESLGIPGKADSRLVVFPETLVPRAAVSILACQLLRAGEGLEVGLAVQYLDQRAVILPAQAEVQGQFIGGTPVVLEIESQDDLSGTPTDRVNAATRPVSTA